MKNCKRLLTLLMTACLLLSMAIPAVWAENAEALTYTFGFDSTTKKVDGTSITTGNSENANANPYVPETRSGYPLVSNNGKTDGYYLNTSRKTGFSCSAGHIQVRNNGAGQWFAIEISGIGKGTYNMTFTYAAGKNFGIYEIYVVSKSNYNTAVGEYFNTLKEGTTLTGSENTAIFNGLTNIVNQNNIGQIDAFKDVDGSEKAQYDMGNVTFPESVSGSYVLMFRCAGKNELSAKYQFALHALTMTPVVEAKIGDTSYATVGAAIAAAKTGDEIDLQADVQTGEIVLPEGVVLDLNGKTLTATMDATQGILTDSSNGGGKIANSAVFDEVGSNEVALVDGEYFRIFDYELEEVETVKNGDTVHFWFDVTLSNDAYALIAKEDNDSEFDVGATLQWNDNTPRTLSYDGNLNVKDWAAKMQTADYSFYVKVTGLSSAAEAGTLKVMPTVSGRVGGGTLANAMTCSVEAAQ